MHRDDDKRDNRAVRRKLPPSPDGADRIGMSDQSKLIGDALRSVYRRTLEEDIPQDFMDLLKKLK
ncbi:MAG: NepR family anti-sigma factor [Blastomonas sp.]